MKKKIDFIIYSKNPLTFQQCEDIQKVLKDIENVLFVNVPNLEIKSLNKPINGGTSYKTLTNE